MKILGIKISELNKDEAKKRVVDFLNSAKQHKIFTPNPEMLVDAQKDRYFKQVLNSGELNVCDGFGIRLVSFGQTKRYAGIDFMLDICKIAEKQEKSIYLLGSSTESLEKASKNLQQKFLKLKIAGYYNGTQLDLKDEKLTIDKTKNQEILEKINNSNAEILFVAFGHNKQEKWIFENLIKMPKIKIAMGVGGAFDYVAGTVKRAPKWMQKIGIEWLYRLIKQPCRLKRIYKATFKFILIYVTKQHTKEN